MGWKPYLDAIPAPPAPLCELMEDSHFMVNSRQYDKALALASLGTDGAPEQGPNFKIQGKLHHLLGPIGPPGLGKKPKFAQLYYPDTKSEVENRQSHQRTRLNPQILQSLQERLHVHNPYVQSFKSALEIVGEDDEKKIALVASKKKQTMASLAPTIFPLGLK